MGDVRAVSDYQPGQVLGLRLLGLALDGESWGKRGGGEAGRNVLCTLAFEFREVNGAASAPVNSSAILPPLSRPLAFHLLLCAPHLICTTSFQASLC